MGGQGSTVCQLKAILYNIYPSIPLPIMSIISLNCFYNLQMSGGVQGCIQECLEYMYSMYIIVSLSMSKSILLYILYIYIYYIYYFPTWKTWALRSLCFRWFESPFLRIFIQVVQGSVSSSAFHFVRHFCANQSEATKILSTCQ